MAKTYNSYISSLDQIFQVFSRHWLAATYITSQWKAHGRGRGVRIDLERVATLAKVLVTFSIAGIRYRPKGASDEGQYRGRTLWASMFTDHRRRMQCNSWSIRDHSQESVRTNCRSFHQFNRRQLRNLQPKPLRDGLIVLLENRKLWVQRRESQVLSDIEMATIINSKKAMELWWRPHLQKSIQKWLIRPS